MKFTPSRTIFNQKERVQTVTIDISATGVLTDSETGKKYIPAGTPVGADDGSGNTIKLIENPNQLAVPKNDKHAQTILVEDCIFDGINEKQVKVACYSGVALLSEVNRACQKVFSKDLTAEAKTGMNQITFKAV